MFLYFFFCFFQGGQILFHKILHTDADVVVKELELIYMKG